MYLFIYTSCFYRDVHKDNQILFVDPLEEDMNAVCVIKLLLIHALRMGLVHAVRHQDRMVQWKSPDFLVICQLQHVSGPLPLESPGTSIQASRSLQRVAIATGLMGRVSGHALRRGALRDTAHLPEAVNGVDTACASMIAGHSKTSESRGITQAYVGALQTPIYSLQATSTFVDRLAPRFAKTPYSTPRKTATEIDDYILKHNLGEPTKATRALAGVHLRKEEFEAWEEDQRTAKEDILAPRSQENTNVEG